jgi:hypothetical protein
MMIDILLTKLVNIIPNLGLFDHWNQVFMMNGIVKFSLFLSQRLPTF